jgi:4-amino-4-deoxy-L-arabinose transferase-like glycosyltransferase
MQRQDRQHIAYWSASPAAALFLLLATFTLRLWRIGHGLPDFLEEAIPFKQAFEMWGFGTGRTDWNPHFFHYPSLSIYLHFLLQKLHFIILHACGRCDHVADYWLAFQIDPTPQILLARSLGILCDGLTVLAIWVLGERWRRGVGLAAGLMIAFSPTMIVTARSIYTDSVMAALALWALERMQAYARAGGRRRLVHGIVLCGLAAGAKYTAGLLVLPWGWALWARHGRRGLRRWPLVAAACLGVFLLSSPYVALDFASFWRDFNFERGHMAAGHLGTLGRSGAWFQLQVAARDWGWLALIMLAVSGGHTLHRLRRGRAGSEVALWLFLLPNLLSVALFRMEAARYLLPVLPVAALLICHTALGLLRSRSGLTGRLTAFAVLALLLGPTVWVGARTATAGGTSTRSAARIWCEEHLTPDELLIQEPYGAPIRNSFEMDSIRQSPMFAAASPSLRERFAALPTFRVVSLPMASSGQYYLATRRENGSRQRLQVFDHASDINQVYYEPLLYRDVDFLLVSSAVADRYRESAARYPRQLALYALLEQSADIAARFQQDRRVSGPDITIYRLGPRFASQLQQRSGELEPFWWARAVPMSFRREFASNLPAFEPGSAGVVQLANGQPTGWVRALRPIFASNLQPFLLATARYLTELGRYAQGRRYAAAVMAMIPDAAYACFLFSQCCTQLGEWEQARKAVEHTLAILAKRDRLEPNLIVEQARLLDHDGELTTAREVLQNLLPRIPAESTAAGQIRRLLADLEARLAPAGRDVTD